jgi:hypothetical protein
MTSTTARRAKLAAKQRAGKERRQMLMVCGLGVLLLGLLAFQLPKLLKSSGSSGSSGTPAVSVPVPVAPAATPANPAALRAALKQPPRDIFKSSPSGSPTTFGNVATPSGRHDPFASPSSGGAAPVMPAPTTPKVPLLPGKIVLGTPGAGKVAVTGWIVILASIPTAAGQSAASSFAKQATKAGVGTPSILNSSNRRPLRGGYWVVYTGPFSTLIKVSAAADGVHRAGFTSAYIRQLTVYKHKSSTTKKK